MAQCIGRIMGRPGDWYAELDFENGEAVIKERGAFADVATMPLGEWAPETEDYNAALDPDCPQAQRLMKVVFAPEAWALLNAIRDELASRRPLEDRGEIRPYQHERQDASLLDEINRALDCLTVPGREDDPAYKMTPAEAKAGSFGAGERTDPEWGDNQTKNPDGLADDRCKQCGKRCPNATCPACQEQNVRRMNIPSTSEILDSNTDMTNDERRNIG